MSTEYQILTDNENVNQNVKGKNLLIFDSQTTVSYYVKYFVGFLLSLILPGLDHFLIFQWKKAICIMVTGFLLRYVFLTAVGK